MTENELNLINESSVDWTMLREAKSTDKWIDVAESEWDARFGGERK